MTTTRTPAFVYVVAFFAGLGGFLFGYDTGVISGALLSMRREFHLSLFEQEVVVASLLLAAGITAPFSGRLADGWGRRKTILLASLLFIVGAIVMAASPNYAWLIVGRLVLGIAIGCASVTVPLYIAELSPPYTRGRLVSIFQLMITVGIVVSYAVDLAFAEAVDAWRWMAGMALIPAVILFVAMWMLPETPRMLVKWGRDEEALVVFRRLGIPEKKMEGTIAKIHEHLRRHRASWRELFTVRMRRPLVTGTLLALFQQITGINAVIYYAPMIFEMTGAESEIASLWATVGVGVVNVLSTLVALWLLDRVGRRPLLLAGTCAMVVGMVALGFSWIIQEGGLAVISLMVYIAGFAVGLGVVAWLFLAEVYPIHIRGRAMSLGTAVNWFANFVVALTFLTLTAELGPAVTFWLYAGIGVLCLIFIGFSIPETKGKTLEEIEDYWERRRMTAVTTEIDTSDEE